MSSRLLNKSQQTILVERLNQLLPYLLDNFTYYRKSFANIDLNIQTLDDLIKFPLVDKKVKGAWELAQEALTNNPPAYFETSGTSGHPFPVLPDLGLQRSKEFADFISEWLGLNNSSRVKRAVIALPFEMNPIGLKYFLALNQLNIMAIPVGVRTHLCPPRKVLDIFDRLQPELLIARPMETLRYAEGMIESGLNPQKSSIKKIILTGEIVSEAKFKRISSLFGNADVYCVYGLTEVDSGGMVSCRNYQYHLPSKPYLAVELLHDDFKTPVTSDGAIGHIVLTNTHQNFMPLFRYKTGDYGVLRTKCDCGQFDTPVINLLGRINDRIHANGKNIFPIQIENILFQYDYIASDYQIIMHGNNLLLRVEWLGDYNLSIVNKFINQIQSEVLVNLGVHIKVQVLEPTALVNKFGIAKSKAGTLHIFSEDMCLEKMNKALEVNYMCCDSL